MSPGSARAARLVAAPLIAAAVAAGGTLTPPAAAAASTPDEVRGPTPRRAWTARVMVPTAVRARPDVRARRTGRVDTVAAWNGGSVELLVLAARTDARGRRWIKVRLPERPNTRSGWMRADFARLSTVRWRVVIDLRDRRARAYHDGHLKRSWPVVVGKRATPTPRGRFAVYERVRQPAGSELGPYALHLTAHSKTLRNYGGGPGRIALHGRAGALLSDPLGSAASHGCVRMNNRVLQWLARRAAPGTPVEIR
ncbi:L,D-transpeptidase [Solirubrobacter sp. CPCC 204708]|uniref:L,D-transpeptidase n=1 Tax=Solirubrobacter deserti TaxID=2282478 RepID=A0ABT4RBK0_9ACTN|nr:L,D-transpeptidase [Solirubrobacter deserti]MBE2317196.1 L,D-transpeptidase [Solirubrobacter deserti]MDA0135911.1 L,D-transpeptidase [Solirubrobacter deserti]